MSSSHVPDTEVAGERGFPDVTDEDGYQLRAEDFDFLCIDEQAAWGCRERQLPLGIGNALYPFFVSELGEALDRERLTDADVRIQGSSVRFFSSPLKPFPVSQRELAQMFMSERGRMPEAREMSAIENRISAQWDANRPNQRPFDSMYFIGISPDPSDIDVQISSFAAFEIVRAIAAARGIDPAGLQIENGSYSFLDRGIADTEFLYLRRWVTRWETLLDRGVAVALFDGDGPPHSDGAVSSHFKSNDWIVDPPLGRIGDAERVTDG